MGQKIFQKLNSGLICNDQLEHCLFYPNILSTNDLNPKSNTIKEIVLRHSESIINSPQLQNIILTNTLWSHVNNTSK